MTENRARRGPTPAPRSRRPHLVILAVVVALFAGVLLAKGGLGSSGSSSEGERGRPASAGDSISSVRNDAIADYEAALGVRKPIYVLFHSLTCDPCIEISEVADQVLPAYEGKVTFVNAITDDASAQKLASRFSFQYIPTSFFLKADGTVIDSYAGVLSAEEMRTRLDALATR